MTGGNFADRGWQKLLHKHIYSIKGEFFAEADANFKMMLYADTAAASTSNSRAPTPSFPWVMDQKFPIQGLS